MPPEMHESFLQGIGRSLGKLSPTRRKCLEEIQDHLTCRSEELIAEGWQPEKAWQQAINEFGEVETFVGLQNQIDQQLKWRWVMRYTTLTILGGFVFVVGLMTMGPEQSRFRAAGLVAQDGSGRGMMPVESSNPLDDSIEAVVRAKLNERVSISTANEMLSDFLYGVVKDEWGLEVYVDKYELENDGLVIDSLETSQNFNSIRASLLLELTLREHGLAYTLRDGILIITTATAAEADVAVRVYDCRGLLAKLEQQNAHPPGMPGMGMMMGGAGGMGAASYPTSDPYSDSKATTRTKQLGGAMPGPGQVGPGQMGSGPMDSGGMMGGMMGSMVGDGMGSGGGMGGGGGMMYGGGTPGLANSDPALYRLSNVIMASVAPDTWSEMGGIGSIAGINGLLVVRQTEAIHQKVEQLLLQLDAAASRPIGSGFRPSQGMGQIPASGFGASGSGFFGPGGEAEGAGEANPFGGNVGPGAEAGSGDASEGSGTSGPGAGALPGGAGLPGGGSGEGLEGASGLGGAGGLGGAPGLGSGGSDDPFQR